MNMNNIVMGVFVFLLISCISCAGASTDVNSVSGSIQNVSEPNSARQTDEVDSILEKMNESTSELKSLQCKIEYRHVQPSVFDMESLRRGILYYSKYDSTSASKAGANNFKFRLNFETLKLDEEDEREYKEQYILVDGSSLPKTKTVKKFEGLWIVLLDYDNKSVKYIQLTNGSKPNSTRGNDIFEIISTEFPMVGFTKTDQLREQFDISLVTSDSNSVNSDSNEKASSGNVKSDELIQVHLKVKPNSVYKDEYVQLDFWIDRKNYLPVKIKAISTEPEGQIIKSKDFKEIKFLDVRVNEKIDNKVFDYQIPKNFDEPDIYPLEN